MKIFMDTSAFYAVADSGDRNHPTAVKKYEELLKLKAMLILSDHVLAECATLIRRRLGYDASDQFLYLLEKSELTGTFRIIYIDELLLAAGKKIFSEMADPKLSLVDALSFAVMKKLAIRKYFAFDDHFRHAGFEPA